MWSTEELFDFMFRLSEKSLSHTEKGMVRSRPPEVLFIKTCFENMQQIYRRTPMPKQLYWNHALPWLWYCKFVAYFQNTSSQENIWTDASVWSILVLNPIQAKFSSGSRFWFNNLLGPQTFLWLKVGNSF